MKDDGSLRIGGEQSPLQRILLTRRSFRKFGKGEAGPEQVARVEDSAEALISRAGLGSARIEILGPGPTFDAVIRAAMKGLVGKINPWLPFMNARHMILCGAVYPEAEGDRAGIHHALAEASMAMQMAVLAATEVGLATCWLAGINHDKIEEVCSMRDGARLIAISPLGLPPKKMGLSWDAMVFHLTSKRRKPLEEIWMRDGWSDRSSS